MSKGKNSKPTAKPRYSSIVKVGNWNEELSLDQYKTQEFIKRRENGELLMQKFQKLFTCLYREVELEKPAVNLRFGAVVQLMAPDVPGCDDYPNEPMVLSITLDANLILETQQVNDKCFLTLAPRRVVSVRNAFMIVSADDADRTSEILKYDQNFMLQTIEAERGPLVLYSSPKTFGLLDVTNCPFNSYKNGEINQNLGLCLVVDKKCENMGCLPRIPPLHCKWKCQNFNPDLRFETEGQPVPTNEKLVISHTATNKLLAAEDSWVKTFFGKERNVSVTTYLTPRKTETEKNVWKLHTSIRSEEEIEMPIANP